MLSDSILADFISELDSNILILLYKLALINLDKIIMKSKIIKKDKRMFQVNIKMIQLEIKNQVF